MKTLKTNKNIVTYSFFRRGVDEDEIPVIDFGISKKELWLQKGDEVLFNGKKQLSFYEVEAKGNILLISEKDFNSSLVEV